MAPLGASAVLGQRPPELCQEWTPQTLTADAIGQACYRCSDAASNETTYCRHRPISAACRGTSKGKRG
eukprot:8907365-Alexandrium_andersonii.AAC.1